MFYNLLLCEISYDEDRGGGWMGVRACVHATTDDAKRQGLAAENHKSYRYLIHHHKNESSKIEMFVARCTVSLLPRYGEWHRVFVSIRIIFWCRAYGYGNIGFGYKLSINYLTLCHSLINDFQSFLKHNYSHNERVSFSFPFSNTVVIFKIINFNWY